MLFFAYCSVSVFYILKTVGELTKFKHGSKSNDIFMMKTNPDISEFY